MNKLKNCMKHRVINPIWISLVLAFVMFRLGLYISAFVFVFNPMNIKWVCDCFKRI